MNVADDVSRGISVQSLTARWQRGPAFLRLSEKEWPHDGSVVNETEEMKEECRRVHMCTKTTAEHPIGCKQFSCWRRLVRVTTYVLRVVWNLRRQICQNIGSEETYSPEMVLSQPKSYDTPKYSEDSFPLEDNIA